ncbi:hypothetical protein BCD67_10465 [Oscillatoriales cyanobacterium USR001]|nr:hypothetical protein BCD67_10465 [Oscillatoriales cyanobacterium USR001]
MSSIIINGWHIYFHPIFAKQRQQLVDEVKKIKSRISDTQEYNNHEKVKLLKHLTTWIREKIPSNPLDTRFTLKDSLSGYCRLKGMGDFSRYRLFFKVGEELITKKSSQDSSELPQDIQGLEIEDYLESSTHEKQGDIVILWLGWPRKKGDKKDCYEVFKKMVDRGEFPDSIEELIAESET